MYAEDSGSMLKNVTISGERPPPQVGMRPTPHLRKPSGARAVFASLPTTMPKKFGMNEKAEAAREREATKKEADKQVSVTVGF